MDGDIDCAGPPGPTTYLFVSKKVCGLLTACAISAGTMQYAYQAQQLHSTAGIQGHDCQITCAPVKMIDHLGQAINLGEETYGIVKSCFFNNSGQVIGKQGMMDQDAFRGHFEEMIIGEVDNLGKTCNAGLRRLKLRNQCFKLKCHGPIVGHCFGSGEENFLI